MFINSIKAADYKTLGSNFARLSLKQLVSIHEILTKKIWFGLVLPPFQSLNACNVLKVPSIVGVSAVH